MRFASDSIIASFRYERCRPLLKEVEASMVNYRHYVESYIHATYTMGGMIVFPKHPNSINQVRGINRRICDRWDLTLECIRRHYSGEESPLSRCLEQDKEFFDLFVDFRGYVDFFYLNGCVTNDYSKVNLWLDTALFVKDPLPKTVSEYEGWIESQIFFVKDRAALMNQKRAASKVAMGKKHGCSVALRLSYVMFLVPAGVFPLMRKGRNMEGTWEMNEGVCMILSSLG